MSLHLAVQSGLVDLSLAKCLVDAPGIDSQEDTSQASKRRRRDYTGGKWLTSKSEQEKNQNDEKECKMLEKQKERKKQEREMAKIAKQQEIKRVEEEREKHWQEKKHEAEMKKEWETQTCMVQTRKCP